MSVFPQGRTATFDAIGPVDAVLGRISRDVPHLFPEVGDALCRALGLLVRHHAEAQNWKVVSLWVAAGLSEEGLQTILAHTNTNHEQKHAQRDGQVVVCPDILNAPEQTFACAHDAAAACDTLLASNELANGILVVLTGADAFDQLDSLRQAQTKLRLMDMTMEKLEDDLRHDPDLLQNPHKLAENAALLDYAYRHIGQLTKQLEFAIAQQGKVDANKFTASLHAASEKLNIVFQAGIGIVLMSNMKGLIHELHQFPGHYPDLDLPYEDEVPRDAPTPQGHYQHLHHLTYNEMNPAPKPE